MKLFTEFTGPTQYEYLYLLLQKYVLFTEPLNSLNRALKYLSAAQKTNVI